MSLSQKPVVGKRPFIVMAYLPDAQGVPKPNRPVKCPCSSEGACIIHIERWRLRICGITCFLAGMHCVTHDVSFTVYPPGWVPYGRKQLALVGHSGGVVETEESLSSWRDTVFEATLDASEKRLWPEEVQLGPMPDPEDRQQSRRTQRRHVAGAMKLFGFTRSQSAREREIISHLIQISVSRLEAGAQKIRAGPSLFVKGEEGVQVLGQLPGIRLMMSGLLALGLNQGYWGPALLQQQHLSHI